MRTPSYGETEQLLARLGVAAEDRTELLAVGPPSKGSDLGDWLEHCHGELVSGIGGTGVVADWPAIDPAYGPLARFFYVWVLLAALPDVRRFHRERGVPDEIGWASLAELGEQMANHRRLYGVGGLRTHNWMTVHFRGANFRIGRLLFERCKAWFDVPGVVRTGDPVLGVHIPRGRLTPDSCDQAFDAASRFFAQCFPDEPYRVATCVSWVLDPTLGAYLDHDSNILAFQRRFQLLPVADAAAPADEETFEAIFGRKWSERDDPDLPRTTTLERAVADHLHGGGHWYYRAGWFASRSTGCHDDPGR